MGLFESIKNRISKTKYKCNYDGCNRYYDINERYDDLKEKLPESHLMELGSLLGFCSDKCFKSEHDMNQIVENFTEP